MGEPMAHNLLKEGHELSVYDLNKEAMSSLASSGASICGNPREVAEQSDILFLMVLTAADVEEVLFGDEAATDGLKPGSIVVCMSSIPAAAIQSIAKRLQESQLHLLDAPVSGGKAGARDASLAIMVGGPPAVFDKVLPYFRLLGSNITLVGESGSGQCAKAANQIIVSITRAAIGEAMLFASKNGADPERVIEALSGGLADSKNLRSYGPRLIEKGEFVEFGSPILKKDINNIVNEAEALNIDLPFAALTRKMYKNFHKE